MSEKQRPLIAEFVGAFAFYFIGAGAIIADSFTHGSVGLLGIALAHGLILGVMVSAFGAVSGGHFNPAITIGLWIAKHVDTSTMSRYLAAQLLGGILAGVTLRIVFPENAWQPVHLGTPALSAGVTPAIAVLLEGVLTFILMCAYLGTVVDSKAPKIGGFAIGLTVTAGMLVGSALTGAGMNPARAFGPALVAGFWVHHWVYWVGPILGASVAAWVYTRLISKTL